MTPEPLYLWHPIHHVWQHNTVCCWYYNQHMWHHLHYRWYHIHYITPNHSIYDVSCTIGMTSQPLYLCHQNFSTDIIPNFVWNHTKFVWHHTHNMCDIICTLYNIISPPYVITLLYLWHHSLYIWIHIQYVGPHRHYTCDITANNLCHHSRSIENITHTLYDITLG